MGELCIDHEEPVLRDFPRGRPFVPPAETSPAARKHAVAEPAAVLFLVLR